MSWEEVGPEEVLDDPDLEAWTKAASARESRLQEFGPAV